MRQLGFSADFAPAAFDSTSAVRLPPPRARAGGGPPRACGSLGEGAGWAGRRQGARMPLGGLSARASLLRGALSATVGGWVGGRGRGGGWGRVHAAAASCDIADDGVPHVARCAPSCRAVRACVRRAPRLTRTARTTLARNVLEEVRRGGWRCAWTSRRDCGRQRVCAHASICKCVAPRPASRARALASTGVSKVHCGSRLRKWLACRSRFSSLSRRWRA